MKYFWPRGMPLVFQDHVQQLNGSLILYLALLQTTNSTKLMLQLQIWKTLLWVCFQIKPLLFSHITENWKYTNIFSCKYFIMSITSVTFQLKTPRGKTDDAPPTSLLPMYFCKDSHYLALTYVPLRSNK